jgi:hypothetical protein
MVSCEEQSSTQFTQFVHWIHCIDRLEGGGDIGGGICMVQAVSDKERREAQPIAIACMIACRLDIMALELIRVNAGFGGVVHFATFSIICIISCIGISFDRSSLDI